MKREQVFKTLARHEPFRLPQGTAQRASVLAPLRPGPDGDDDIEIVLTRRTQHPADPHSGQVSFPGGREEVGDPDRQATALREAQEELGIPRDRVQVVGFLDDMLTVTGYHVVPVIGWIPTDIELVPNPDEVARVFTVPLAELMLERRWQQRVHSWRSSKIRVWHFPHDGEDIWGATAFMLRQMVELLRE